MLPSIIASKLPKAAITGVIALGVALSTMAPAQALGRNERNFLKGVAAAVVVDQVIKGVRNNQRQRVYSTAPSYSFVQPAPTYATARPTYQARPVYQPRPTYQSAIYSTPMAQAFNSYSSTDRKRIQQRLAAQGYYTSGIDGSFGPGTYTAISSYAAARGETGKLNTPSGVFGVFDGLIY